MEKLQVHKFVTVLLDVVMIASQLMATPAIQLRILVSKHVATEKSMANKFVILCKAVQLLVSH